MKRTGKVKWAIGLELLLFAVIAGGLLKDQAEKEAMSAGIEIMKTETEAREKEVIRWVDFTPTMEAMDLAYEKDLEAREQGTQDLDWISLLAYGAARNGGKFDKRALKDIQSLADKILQQKATLEEATKDLSYYDYYKEAYDAVLGGAVGTYRIQEKDEAGNLVWKEKYGLKAFSPIAKGFPYSDYDDFGSSRSYGYQRPHLGHDMMGQIGTPVICIESGYVEALGWNQYGGWRIGIRSFDGKRYYYYAHLRQDYPYFSGLKEGDAVTAGDVIGYMGHTGYSSEENVNNIDTVHLHWGLQLIFDESQKDSDHEIWIDCYQLSRFYYRHRSEAVKVPRSKDWKRVYAMEDPGVEEWKKTHKTGTGC